MKKQRESKGSQTIITWRSLPIRITYREPPPIASLPSSHLLASIFTTALRFRIESWTHELELARIVSNSTRQERNRTTCCWTRRLLLHGTRVESHFGPFRSSQLFQSFHDPIQNSKLRSFHAHINPVKTKLCACALVLTANHKRLRRTGSAFVVARAEGHGDSERIRCLWAP